MEKSNEDIFIVTPTFARESLKEISSPTLRIVARIYMNNPDAKALIDAIAEELVFRGELPDYFIY